MNRRVHDSARAVSNSAFDSDLCIEAALGLTIELAQGHDDRDLLYGYLNQALPVIVFVNTAELKSYWKVPTFHAVVVTGLDDEWFYLHDPYFVDAPLLMHPKKCGAMNFSGLVGTR